MATDAQRRACAKYDKNNTVMLTVKLNKQTDADIIAYLEKSGNTQGAVKKALREQINKGSE